MEKHFLQKSFKKIIGIILLSFSLVAGGFLARPLLAEYALTQANYYFNGGTYNLSVASKWYKTADFFGFDPSFAHYQLARIYFVENKLVEAKKEIDIALVKNPDNQRAFYIRGLIDGFAKNYGEAISDFEKFTAWSPKEWAGWNDLAWVSYEAGDYTKAKEAAFEGLKIDAVNPWLLNNLGLAYLGLGEKKRAQEIFIKTQEKADLLTIEDWQKAYPGNNPNSAEWSLAKFRANVKYNTTLASTPAALSAVLPKGIAASACHSATYHRCSGTSCVAYTCDSDHQFCSNSCSNKTDCGWVPPRPQCTPSCGGWSGCSASCGGGSQSRTCTRSNCSTYGESQSCNNQCCAQDGGWSGWSSCSVSCGGGTQSRSCNNPSPSCGGSGCSGPSSQSCNTQCCPVDGGWGSWGDWSNCSVSCGGGEQSRSRPCNNPSPYCGGSYCSGAGTNSRSCNNQACPPTLNFSSSATNIFEGWDVILSWATTWVTSCTATGGWSGSKAAGGGNETVIPPIPSATYNLNCSGPGGSIQRSVTINVAPLILPDWREIIPR